MEPWWAIILEVIGSGALGIIGTAWALLRKGKGSHER